MQRPLRKHRVCVDLPVECTDTASGDRVAGRVTDISLGGLRMETPAQLAFGAAVVVHIHLPGAADALAIDAVVRWTRPGAVGVQFGSLGVRETHLITELSLGSQTLDAMDVAWVG